MAVTTLTGNNSFLIERELKARVKIFAEVKGEMGVERIDAEGADPMDVMSRLGAPSLFSDERITVIRDLSRNSELSEQFLSILDSPPEDIEIVVVEPRIDARSRLYKALKSKSDFKEFNQLKSHELNEWVIKAVAASGGEISRSVAQYLVDRAGNNQELLSNEIKKLVLYSPKITQESVDLLVEANLNSTTFDLANAAFSHKKELAIKLYQEQRALRVDPKVIIGSLAWQLQVLALLKTASRKTPDQIGQDSGLSPWAISKAVKLANGISYAELTRAVDLLLEIDSKSKTTQFNADDALVYFLLKIS